MPPKQPYLIRALYDWITDNQMTAHILVNADFPNVNVPQQFIQDSKIILNIAPQAVSGLCISNDAVEFRARFGMRKVYVHVPVGAVGAIFAHENGEGLAFPTNGEEPVSIEAKQVTGTPTPTPISKKTSPSLPTSTKPPPQKTISKKPPKLHVIKGKLPKKPQQPHEE